MFQALRSLPAARLREMATAFRQGALGIPSSELALERIFPIDQVPALKGDLDELARTGHAAGQAAVLMDVLAEAADREASAAEQTKLVWTGPEAAGIVNRDTRAVAEELFRSARHSVL